MKNLNQFYCYSLKKPIIPFLLFKPIPLREILQSSHSMCRPHDREKSIKLSLWNDLGFPDGARGKERIRLPMQGTRETRVQSLGREDPQRRAWQPTPVFFLGQRSLDCCSPQGCKESDMTKQLSTHTWNDLVVLVVNKQHSGEYSAPEIALLSCPQIRA